MENNNNDIHLEDNQNSNNTPKNQSQIVAAIIVVGLFIVGAILLKGTKPNDSFGLNNDQDATKEVVIKPISTDEHILGNPDAKIFIVEYSDTECPFCKNFHNTMIQTVAQSDGQVAWVYRHFPIASLHAKAFHEAEATECAWEQGGNETFWKYTNEVYARTQSNDQLDVAELPKIAESLGLDMITFNTCLASGKYADKIDADIMDGQNAGVRGTPTSFIVMNGKVVDMIQGAQPFEALKIKLSSLLK